MNWLRYRVYGVIDLEAGVDGIESLLDEMRQYGSADVLDVQVMDEIDTPLASTDFAAHYQRRKE